MKSYETLEAKLKRHEDALVACMAEITRLREENARVRSSENNAHSALKEIYNDPDAPPACRIKAATAALPHEMPQLMPERAPLKLTAAPIEDLATVVARQRARSNRLLALSIEERSALITGVVRGDGNGSDDSSSND